MQRFSPYLGILAALLVFAFVVAFSSDAAILYTPTTALATTTPSASSTLSVLPGFTLPQLTLPNFIPSTSVEASSTHQDAPIKKVASPVPEPAPVAFVAPAPPASTLATVVALPPLRNVSLDASASALINALVNIICYVPQGSGLHSISGSGVIIDSKGIILTNAHIAQYFLLADRGVACIIRSGSPATNSYKASLIYISPAWLNANPTVLTQANPSGTGEYDFALLAVTSSIGTQPLSSSFFSLPLATDPLLPNTPVVIASYGAQFLESNQIKSSLFPTLVYGSVKEVFTFAVNTIDVFEFGGSAIAQEGSSGGGVASENGELVGTITTSTVEGDVNTRSLDAITASYIRAEYANETSSALDLLLAKPTTTSVADFASQISTLESIITAQLP